MKGYDIRSEWETLVNAVNGMSLGRSGDGEQKIATGKSAKSQQYDKRLADILKAFYKAPGVVMCGIPSFDKRSPKYVTFWRGYEARFRPLLNPSVVYFNAFVSRPDSSPWIDVPEYWQAMRQLWAGKDVILVRGSGKSLTKERLEAEAESVHEILCPVRHAFTEYDNLKATLKREHAGRTVLLAAGATATALAYELGNEGIHMVDLGHAGMFVGRREGQFNQ